MRELGKSYFVPTFKRTRQQWMMRGFRVWNGVRCGRWTLYMGRKLREKYDGCRVIPELTPRKAWRAIKCDARYFRMD